MEKNENIKVATKQLEEISEEEINQRIAELREKARRDDVALLSTGKRLGREEAQKEMEQYIAELKEKARRDDVAMRLTGERIGRKKVQKEIIDKMLNLNISIDQISEITGLTSEEIKNISNN